MQDSSQKSTVYSPPTEDMLRAAEKKWMVIRESPDTVYAIKTYGSQLLEDSGKIKVEAKIGFFNGHWMCYFTMVSEERKLITRFRSVEVLSVDDLVILKSYNNADVPSHAIKNKRYKGSKRLTQTGIYMYIYPDRADGQYDLDALKKGLKIVFNFDFDHQSGYSADFALTNFKNAIEEVEQAYKAR